MAQPTDLPRWATAQTAQVTEPLESKKDLGYVPSEKPAAQNFNWLMNRLCQWAAYLKNLTNEALTWRARQSFQAGASCPTPIDGADVVNKSYVDNAINGLGAGFAPQTYDTNDPTFQYSAQNPLLFWKDSAGFVHFVGELLSYTKQTNIMLGIMPIGMRPLKEICIVAAQWPNPIIIKVETDGSMYPSSPPVDGGMPIVFSGCSYKAGQ